MLTHRPDAGKSSFAIVSALRGHRFNPQPVKFLIEKALNVLEKPLAMRIFFLISFLESAFLPIPVESLSIPLLTARENPWPIAIWGTVSSVLGGIVGYLIGLVLFETVGQLIINVYGLQEQYESITATADENLLKGSWIVLLGAVSPLPFKLVSIAAGTIGFHFLVFMVVATVGRAIRFFAFAAAFHFFGDRLRAIIHRYPRAMSVLVILVMLAGFGLLLL